MRLISGFDLAQEDGMQLLGGLFSPWWRQR